MLRIKTILVPVDFTDSSNRAADYAVALARQFHAKIVLLHVIEPFTYSVTDTIVITDHYAALGAIADRMMDLLARKLSKHGIKIERAVMSGSPYWTILDQARKRRSDLIVMGTHGRTGIEHLLVGSVAERVVRLAPCPVLTVGVGPVRRSGGGRQARRPVPRSRSKGKRSKHP